MDLFNELKQRGLVYQVSNEEAVKKLLETKGVSFYTGYDPTAESLHVGNLLQIVMMKRLEKAGLKPIVLVGGATGLIGDPSGRLQERALNTKEVVKKMSEALKKQLRNFFDKKTVFVNNNDWIGKTSLIEYLRDIGKYFTISEMIKKESVETRLQTGISFTEFSYMTLQAYDFLNIFDKYKCRLQLGGSDQWGNITAGMELIRKLRSQETYGLTLPLVTTADGKKMGKSESGAVWLDAKMTSPYHFYQFWLNVDDRDAVKFLKYYTFLSLEEIKKIEEGFIKQPEKREAQKVLAKEMTEFVHGKGAYERAQKISEKLFYGKVGELNKVEVEEIFTGSNPKIVEAFKEINIIDFLVLTEISASKRQAREDIQNNAIEINGQKIMSLDYQVAKKDFLFGNYIISKRGKKDYRFIKIK